MDISNILGLAISLIIFVLYSMACLISIIFTFSLDTYKKLDDMVDLNVLSNPVLVPGIEHRINKFDLWAMEHHRIIGIILIISSLINLKLTFSLVNSF
jgi:hypothetical protein